MAGLGAMMMIGVDTTPPPFNPTNIAGCQLWLRADLGVTQIATIVSAWADQSGTGDSNKNFTSSGNPTITANNSSFNNQSTINFNATLSQTFTSGTWASSLPNPYTIFMVVDDTPASLCFADYGYSQAAEFALVDVGDGHYGYSAAGSTVPNITVSFTTPQAIAIQNNVGSSAAWASTITAGATGGFSAFTIKQIRLGAATYYNDLTGSIAEVIVYDSVLSTTNFTTIMNYLGTRYNITIGA